MNMIDLPSLDSLGVKGKRVIVRCDFDVPFDKEQNILDETRLISSISTIEYLLEQNCTVIACGHMGRPDGKDEKLSLKPVADWFAEEFPGTEVKKTQLGGFLAWKIKENFYILENLRFYKEEEKNDFSFSHKLAYLGDVYVNEAFGSSHRAHSSIVGVARLLPHFAGFHFQKEIKILTNVIENPRKPFTFIIGGAKIETKLPLISKMHNFADYVLVGGELAEQTKILIEEQHKSKSLPAGRQAILLVAELNEEKTNITKTSLENFLQVIPRSKCIIWNGPMGYIEGGFTDSTEEIAKAVLASSAYKVVGGGDTIGFLNNKGLLGRFDFVSTGGGAMLEFLSGESLPGIIALQNNT